MTRIIIIALIIIFLLIAIILFIKCKLANTRLLKEFKNHSVIVFGAKGKGKDLLFQKVIYLRNKEDYFSNIDYGYKGTHIDIKDLSVKPNSFRKLIAGTITQIEKKDNMEGKDVYISDAGIYFPCQYDYDLNRLYPDFPIYYALSRHLYNSNIHMNTQNIERPWKIVREQADSYIMCKNKIKLLFGIFIQFRIYDKYQSAVDRLLPVKARILNKISKAEADIYNAKNGDIKDFICYIKKKHIKYDTRIFHKYFFGVPAPKKIKKSKNPTTINKT